MTAVRYGAADEDVKQQRGDNQCDDGTVKQEVLRLVLKVVDGAGITKDQLASVLSAFGRASTVGLWRASLFGEEAISVGRRVEFNIAFGLVEIAVI